MNLLAWLVLVAICGFVWGGFVYFLLRGMRSEAIKASREAAAAGPERENPTVSD
jgi:hypothetical protein